MIVNRLLPLGRIWTAAKAVPLVTGAMESVQPQARASRKAFRCRGFDEELPYRRECHGTPSNMQ